MAAKSSKEPEPEFFATPAEWRKWLEKKYSCTQELWVGFYKRDSGRPSITWPEAVDGALCFGWIDGVRKSIDAFSYKIRFTPRKPRSIWSAINIKRAKELAKLGLLHPAGLAAFEKRDGDRSAIYAYEQRRTAQLPRELEKAFRAKNEAWAFFQSQPPWYRRTSTYWVISAKREETRLKRLATLIDCSARKRNIPSLIRPSASR
ncbi:MAG TPA: YdeI/OmpD-associated family protein [Candidatus Sulfotelmatobacter sp.]|nr:YdeI/OmpD-associated family protein [Candidatus Sulfotelmatobacter sp.]